MFSGKPKKLIKSEDLISEFNFVNHVRNLTSNVEMKIKDFKMRRLNLFLGTKGLRNNCRAFIESFSESIRP